MDCFPRLLNSSHSRAWTEEELSQLVTELHVHLKAPNLKLLRRSRDDCERQYRAFFAFRYKALRTDDPTFDLIDRFYELKETGDQLDASSSQQWTKDETTALFKCVEQEGAQATSPSTLTHYYEVVGIAFRRPGRSLEACIKEGISDFFKAGCPKSEEMTDSRCRIALSGVVALASSSLQDILCLPHLCMNQDMD